VLKFDDSLSLSPGAGPISVDVSITTVDQGKPTTPKFDFIGAVIFSNGKNNTGLFESEGRNNTGPFEKQPEVPPGG
jgi:hypothetical protein